MVSVEVIRVVTQTKETTCKSFCGEASGTVRNNPEWGLLLMLMPRTTSSSTDAPQRCAEDGLCSVKLLLPGRIAMIYLSQSLSGRGAITSCSANITYIITYTFHVGQPPQTLGIFKLLIMLNLCSRIYQQQTVTSISIQSNTTPYIPEVT